MTNPAISKHCNCVDPRCSPGCARKPLDGLTQGVKRIYVCGSSWRKVLAIDSLPEGASGEIRGLRIAEAEGMPCRRHLASSCSSSRKMQTCTCPLETACVNPNRDVLLSLTHPCGIGLGRYWLSR